MAKGRIMCYWRSRLAPPVAVAFRFETRPSDWLAISGCGGMQPSAGRTGRTRRPQQTTPLFADGLADALLAAVSFTGITRKEEMVDGDPLRSDGTGQGRRFSGAEREVGCPVVVTFRSRSQRCGRGTAPVFLRIFTRTCTADLGHQRTV